MGGFGSGSQRRLSDAEKERKGTAHSTSTEAAITARKAAKIVSGPWLTKIPRPQIPLKPFGRKKYDYYTQLLFDQGKLTRVTCDQAEVVALLFQQLDEIAKRDEEPKASLYAQLQRGIAFLRVAEDAPTLAEPGKKNTFAACGFSNSRAPSVRLREPAAPDLGKRGRRARGS